MENKVLIRRYSTGLVSAIHNRKEYQTVYSQLKKFTDFLYSTEELKNVLLSPFIPALKKKPILEEILKKNSWKVKVKRYLRLLLENNRLNLLPSIVEFLPQLWSELQGIQTFEVFSPVSLTENQKKKLKKTLQQIENKKVELKYKIDPQLIGGLYLKKKNIIYDVSLRGDLYRIRQKISER